MTDLREDGASVSGKVAASPGQWDVREARIRQARRVIREIKRIADEKGMTMNALITAYIDAGLKGDGRRGVYELAPWFSDYLRRKGGSDCRPHDPFDPDEEFI